MKIKGNISEKVSLKITTFANLIAWNTLPCLDNSSSKKR